MLNEKSSSNRFKLLNYFLIFLLPLLLSACGGETAYPVTSPTTLIKPITSDASTVAAQGGLRTTTVATIPPKASISSGNNTKSSGNAKAPKSGEETCALVTKEEVTAIFGVSVDKIVPQSLTGFECNYYAGETFLVQVFFEKVAGSKGVLDANKVVYADAKQIPAVGDYNWWSANSGRYEILQGSSYFAVVILPGETDKVKLLEQATTVAQLVISRIK